MDIYRELILDHYKHPRNFGHLEKPDVVMEEHNVSCGDRIVIEIKSTIHDQKSTISEIMFSGEGCAISQASASMLTEKVMSGASHPELVPSVVEGPAEGSRSGMSIDDIMKLTTEDITDMLGTELTPSRVKCVLLSLEVLQKAITALKK